MGVSQRQIALKLKVDRSTISRELKRNRGRRGYRFQQADTLATERRYAASAQPKCMTPDNTRIIEQKLQEGWSPDQISGRLELEEICISSKTIYRHIWSDRQKGGLLYRYLRHKGKKYNHRVSAEAGRGCIPNRVDIKERPAIVDKKSRIGDWEGDTIIGAHNKGAILTLVDRKSKLVVMEKLRRKTAKKVCNASKRRLNELPHKVCTITFDNGKEFSAHQDIAKALNTHCYFATPYHSWERALNEHTNGLIRQYIPKGINLATIPVSQIKRVEIKLNNRPRKVLKYQTPREVFFELQT
jgi:IS30 family transposase